MSLFVPGAKKPNYAIDLIPFTNVELVMSGKHRFGLHHFQPFHSVTAIVFPNI
jgi:hypothetical protein